jgi:preprotein translocase subunit SecE
MRGIKRYFQEAFQELFYKVSWPSWSELQSSALLVMGASVIIALVVFGMDFSFRSIVQSIYKLFF